MTATERFLTTIDHEEPDRVPMHLMGVPPYSRTFQEWLAREEELMDEWTEDDYNVLITPLGDFTLRYFLGSELETWGVGIATGFAPLALDDDGRPVDDLSVAAELLKRPEGRQVDYFGRVNGWRYLEGGHRYAWYVDGFLKTKQDVLDWYEEHGWPHEKPVNKLDVEALVETRRRFGDRACFVPQIGNCQLYESSWPVMGQSRWALYSRKDPEFVKRVIESRKLAQLKILDEIARLKPHVDVVFGGDDMGQKGRPMFSPAWFEKFLAEPFAEIFEKVHEELGAKVFIHSCGNMVELLPQLVECGLDGWQSLEPASEIDFPALKRKFGDHLFFVGALDSSREACFGNSNSIRKHVAKQLRTLGPGGGYVAGPAHDYLNVPLENALALRDAVLELGRYPLS